MLLLTLLGCDRLAVIERLLEERANPLVAQGVYLGLDVPPGVEFEESDDLHVAACSVFLASVTDPSQLEDSPVSGAELHFRSGENGILSLGEVEQGKYVVTSVDELVYAPGEEARVSFAIEDEEGSMVVDAPEAPDVDVPAEHRAFESLSVSVPDTYDGIVAAVYDLDRSKLTWDSLPEAVDEVYEFTHSDEPVHEVDIPGDAFRRKGTYIVGVAGMTVAGTDGFEGVNTSLSAFIAGRLSIHAVSVSAPDEL